MTSSRRLTPLFARVMCVLGLLHVLTVALSVLPPNPISESLAPQIAGYIGPIFRQQWWLFAPEPSRIDRTVLVRGINPASKRETSWHSLLEPLHQSARSHLPSDSDLARTTLLNATYELTGPLIFAAANDVDREILVRVWSAPASKPAGLTVLERAGASYLTAKYPDEHFMQVQLRVISAPIPPPESNSPPIDSPGTVDIEFPPAILPAIAAWTLPR